MPLEAGLEAAATAELPLAFELAILLHFTANQSLSIFKAFNDYFEDGRNPYTARTAKNYDTYICVVSPTTSTCRGRRTSTGAAV